MRATASGIMQIHRDHYTAPRDRNLWLRFNLLDFSIFVGWPVLAWVGALSMRRAALDTADRARESLQLLVVVGAVILAIDLADLTRAEVGRVWMPLMPMVFAGLGVAASQRGASRAEWLLCASMLVVLSMTIAVFWGM